MPDISINASIFAHIELDSELKGRYGLKGNIFKNTFGYLNQYLQKIKSHPPHLTKFVRMMNELVAYEDERDALDTPTDTKLPLFCAGIADKISELALNQDIAIPGGWRNPADGHAMIYQFTKTKEGIRFSMYNTGAGIEYHDKLSSLEKEQYYPVKQYHIPHPCNPKELTILLYRLILPRLPEHPDRKKRIFDAKKLYQSIDESLAFLNAEPIKSSEFISDTLITSGQISGTCTQRSIHQMLKIYFGDIIAYRQFILDFKLYALRDFLNTHPAPRSAEINYLIQCAIENNLKILQEPGVFNPTVTAEARQKEKIANTLIDLKAQLSIEGCKKTHHHTAPNPINALDFKITIPVLSASRKLSGTQDTPLLINTAKEPLCIQNGTNLLKQIKNLTRQCYAMMDTDPLWVLMQIEQNICQLPLPSAPIIHTGEVKLTSYYQRIAFYGELKDPQQLIEMVSQIDALQKCYGEVYQRLLGNVQLPNLLVTHWSFLALCDYFDVQLSAQTSKPSFHGFINQSLGAFVNGFCYSAYLLESPKFSVGDALYLNRKMS